MKKENPHWIRHTHFFDPDDYECSRCGRRFREKRPACPHCGAPMTGEKEKEDWVDELEELSWIMEDD